jgi:hypothetical protein
MAYRHRKAAALLLSHITAALSSQRWRRRPKMGMAEEIVVAALIGEKPSAKMAAKLKKIISRRRLRRKAVINNVGES